MQTHKKDHIIRSKSIAMTYQIMNSIESDFHETWLSTFTCCLQRRKVFVRIHIVGIAATTSPSSASAYSILRWKLRCIHQSITNRVRRKKRTRMKCSATTQCTRKLSFVVRRSYTILMRNHIPMISSHVFLKSAKRRGASFRMRFSVFKTEASIMKQWGRTVRG